MKFEVERVEKMESFAKPLVTPVNLSSACPNPYYMPRGRCAAR
jgi:hypothetical protein